MALSPTKDKRLILVLGMHRSGTSVLARGLKVLGVDLGNHLIPSGPDNPRGFWEDSDVNALNIALMKALGRDWHTLAPIESDDFLSGVVSELKPRAETILRDKFSISNCIGLKDPRIVLLLPFWKEIFARLELNVSYLIACRNPKSVARSLAARNGFDLEKGYYLWLMHMLGSLTQTVGHKRILVDYDQLISNPAGQLQRIAQRLGLVFDPQGSEFAEYRAHFLDDSLCHTKHLLEDLYQDKIIPPSVVELYKLINDFADDSMAFEDPGAITALDHIREQFNEYNAALRYMSTYDDRIAALACKVTELESIEASLSPSVAEQEIQIVELEQAVIDRNAHIDSLNRILLDCNSQIASLQEAVLEGKRDIDNLSKDIVARNNLVEMMHNSRSWRITRPFRAAARIMRYGIRDDDRRAVIQVLRTLYHRLPLSSSMKSRIRFYYRRITKDVTPITSVMLRDNKQVRNSAKRPVNQQSDKWDYIIWGVIDWFFRHQRPQQLAQALAATGRRVFYISSSLVDSKHAGFEFESINPDGNLFQIKLHAKGAPSIYSSAPGIETVTLLRKSIGEVLEWANCGQNICVVQHPFWFDVASTLPNSRLVYDCMDHHEGFDNTGDSVARLESALMKEAKLTITTSEWLDNAVVNQAQHHVLLRNACEYNYFSRMPEITYNDPQGRRIIGYYGAIAEWFDLDLVEAVAMRFPTCCILLVGADTADAQSRLKNLPNVIFIGEVPYSKLTYYLYSFDVCLLPFKLISLTLATNPVKIYEYLSAGKPVVTVDLPEVAQFAGLVYTAVNEKQFIDAIDKVLVCAEPQELIERRKHYAAGQTWEHRAQVLIKEVESADYDLKVSIVVVTFNNLDLTRMCLQSIGEHSQYDALEIIVVDNASDDGSQEFLKEWAAIKANRKLILNDNNRGFAAANNQGLDLATGDFLVLLNNDTYVTPGWLRTMVDHLKRDETIGLIGPVTNNIGNEARIDLDYTDMEAMLEKSTAYTRRHIGQIFPLKTAAFFCVMMRRNVYEKVGPLDEAFGRGFFEDDDYCRRVEQVGLRIVCAEDVFVHHHLSASFDKLKDWDRQALFEQNKAVYEAKWGKWVPHDYR